MPTINQADGSFLSEGAKAQKFAIGVVFCQFERATLGVVVHIFPLPCVACRWSYADEVVLEGVSCSLGLRLGFQRSVAFCSPG